MNISQLNKENSVDSNEMEAFLLDIDYSKDKFDRLKFGEKIEQFNLEPKRSETLQHLRNMEIQEQKRFERGDGQNYINYCSRCLWDYESSNSNCYKCRKTSMTLEEPLDERHQGLREIYQLEKVKKAEQQRRIKTTPRMLFKKSLNYGRWDYFGSSDDEFDTESELHKEMECKMRKQRDQEQAESLKLLGNECMKTREYEKAVMRYTEALELVKDIKALWLNRALAYIKLKKFRKAINDCSCVIDYAEKYEKGYTVSKESCFKAFLRRGTAFKERKDYEQALRDAEQALVLCPNDKEALQLKNDVETLRTQQLSRKDSESNEFLPVELNYKNSIDLFIQKQFPDIKVTDIMDLLKNMRFQPEQTKHYFQEKQGLQKLLEVISSNYIGDASEENETLGLRMLYLLLRFYLVDNTLYQEEFINIGGIVIIMNRINSFLFLCQGTQKSYIYFLIEDYLELFICMGIENRIRGLLNNNSTLIGLLHNQLFDKVLKLYKTEISLLCTFINLCSNLCYGSSLLKQSFEKDYINVIEKISPILDNSPESNKYVDLLIAINNLLSNFLSESSFRQQLVQDEESHYLIFKKLIQQLNCVKLNDQTQCRWIESVLAIFVNILYQAKDDAQTLIESLGIGSLLVHKFIFSDQLQPTSQIHRIIASRTIQVLSKLNYTLHKYLIYPVKGYFILYMLDPYQKIDRQEKTNDYTQSVLRLIMQVFSTSDEESKKVIKQALQDREKLFQLLENLRFTLMSDYENVFANCCSAIGAIIDMCPLSPEITINQKIVNPSTFFHQVIPRLITIVRDKQGNFRKNAAILLVKLLKDQKNYQTIRDLNGFEILKSVVGHKIQK